MVAESADALTSSCRRQAGTPGRGSGKRQQSQLQFPVAWNAALVAVGGAALLSVESSSPLEMLPCVHFEGRRGEQPDAFRANLIAQAGAESADVAVDGAVAKRSRLAPIINFARMVEEYWLGIIRWFASRITNGLLEGLNSLV